jgi:hypothetical protein
MGIYQGQNRRRISLLLLFLSLTCDERLAFALGVERSLTSRLPSRLKSATNAGVRSEQGDLSAYPTGTPVYLHRADRGRF